ncbi:hypothetical protein BTHE68_39900 [Burkholderia sp. THE68]|uniref:hypothetical protein n=1 Tax=Burkholderia sp. THE68 TaxID=758782 RepID=UPI0013196548|nr:hypothetical protein [Burkholderia sp. THE68]BBU30256.1 hypothetical protein BTHE68_39900 [Burkholderia sp. THE68]
MAGSKDNQADAGHVAFRLGSLERASDYASVFDEAVKLDASAPVFGAWVDPSLLDGLEGKSVFRVGAIRFDEIVVMTMRMQKGRCQFIWLADAADPEFWAAMDEFRKAGQAGFAFRPSPNDLWFIPYRTDNLGPTVIDPHRAESGREDKGFVQLATVLLARDSISLIATSMIPGVPVEHKQVNVLATRRVMSLIGAIQKLESERRGSTG